MRIGVFAGSAHAPGTLEELLKSAKSLEEKVFSIFCLTHVFALDAIAVLGLIGRETRHIELMTAVVPAPPRHPMALAQQALTAEVAWGGRFTPGIGPSHQLVIEGMMGLSYGKPAAQTRE